MEKIWRPSVGCSSAGCKTCLSLGVPARHFALRLEASGSTEIWGAAGPLEAGSGSGVNNPGLPPAIRQLAAGNDNSVT